MNADGDGALDAERAEPLATLLADYQAARDDSRGLEQSLINFISVGVALLAVYGTLLGRTCSASKRTGSFSLSQCRAATLPWLYAVTPLVAVSILGVIALAGALASQRSYYVRELELRILEESGQAIPNNVLGALPAPVFSHLSAPFLSHRRGPKSNRFLILILYSTIAILAIGTTAFSLYLARPLELQIIGCLFYGLVAAALVRVTWFGSLAAEANWASLRGNIPAEFAATRHRRSKDFGSLRDERSLTTYLLLPRPGDIAVKAPLIVATALVIALAEERIGASRLWFDIVGAVIVFELMAYQGRYVLNDIRGILHDGAHETRSRTRFPALVDPEATAARVRTSLGTVALRVVLALYLPIHIFGVGRGAVISGCVLAVFVLGGVYDGLRERSVTVASEDPLAHVLDSKSWSHGGSTTSVYLLVGLGYSLRIVVGAVAGSSALPPVVPVGLLAAAAWALGMMFVTMTWAVDGLHFLGRVENEAGYGPTIDAAAFPHFLPLVADMSRRPSSRPIWHKSALPLEFRLASTPSIPPRSERVLASDASLLKLRPLKHANWLTWWNASFVVSAACAVAAGTSLARLSGTASLLCSVLTAVAAAMVVVRVPVLAMLGIAAAAATEFGQNNDGRSALLAVLPLAVVSVVYLGFRSISPADIEFEWPLVWSLCMRRIGELQAAATSFFIGRHASALLHRNRDT